MAEVTATGSVSVGGGTSSTTASSKTTTISNDKASVDSDEKCYTFSCFGQPKKRTICLIVLKTSQISIPWQAVKYKIAEDGTETKEDVEGNLVYDLGVDVY